MSANRCTTFFLRHSIAAAVLLVCSTTARATILEFDQIRLLGQLVPTISGNDLPPDYGDRVTSPNQAAPGGQFTYGEASEGFTPNVVVEYLSTSAIGINDVTLWQDAYGDLTNILFGNPNSSTLSVRLTADSGFSALLYGFDLGGWPNTDYTIDAVRVLDGLTPLFTNHDVLVEGVSTGPRHTSFAFAAPLSGSDLLIEIDYSNLVSNQRDNIGIDNIRFGQDPPGIPEPSTALLVALGAYVLLPLVRR